VSDTADHKAIMTQLDADTPPAIVDCIVVQIQRARAAGERVEAEGVIVRDVKGSVIPHPAIKVEADASRIVAEMVDKYRAT
jgi:phage terminase small subunit